MLWRAKALAPLGVLVGYLHLMPFVQGLVAAMGAAGVVGLLGVTAGLANNKTCSPCEHGRNGMPLFSLEKQTLLAIKLTLEQA